MKKQNHLPNLPNQPISTGLLILLFLFVFAALPAAAGAQIFVDADAGGANNGTSWDDAYTTLQDALTTGFSGEIWVAEGVYFPDEGGLMIDNDRSATFQLFDGVEIYGGFDPGDNVDEFGERDWQAHPTILSGDIDGNDTTTDGVVTDTGDIDGGNSYNVVTGFGTGGTILLDGFIITAGLADDSANNSGGGMFNTDNSTVLTNVIFSGNSASFFGGGMYNLDSSPVLTNVTFSDNSAELGGGMFNDNSSSALTNVTLSNNSASVRGGGIYNDTSSSTLTNTILWGNTADFGGNEMYNESDGSATLNYSLYKNDEGDIVEGGGFTATNSLTTDPLFADPVNGDYSLQDTSPAINTGDPDTDMSLFPGGPGNPLDLAANPRLDAVIIDMGAYEFQGAPARFIPDENNILYVDKNVSGGNQTGDSWANAIPELRDALDWAGNELDGTLQIWTADGLYLPTGDDTDRSATFRLVNNVEVYGGFDGGGGEENLTDRDIDANPTILSGDIDGNDTTTDGVVTDTGDISGGNSYNVVTGTGNDGTARLDGFTVTAGLADEGGGGMINESSSNPTLTNVIFSGNSASIFGGGMYNLFDSNPTLTNVTFSGNSSGFNGGGIYNESSSNPTLTNVIFTGNSANNDGGGIYNDSSSNPTLTNVIFSGNSTGESGGGLFNFNSNPSLTNVIIWDNEAGGVTTSTSSSIFNSGSNPDISHSLIANSGGSGTDWEDAIGNDGDNNIDTDPLFVDPTDPDGADDTFGTDDDGLALQDTSPAINTGDPNTDPSLFPGGPGAPIDLAANPRLDAVIIDMGAYEFQGASVPLIPDENNILYVDKNVSDGNQTGDSWANAIPELRDALDWAGNEWDGSSPPLQIWVADGLYLPTGDDTDRSATFRLVNNVEIYGGFEGGGSEDELSDRDIAANPAILSGDIGGDDVEEIISDPETEINGSNSFHVVTGSGTDGTARLDGFTVTAGLADGGGFDDFGSGMLNDGGSPALAGLTVSGSSADRGGGIGNFNSSPTLTNVTFSDNSADFSGGGMYNNDDSNPTLTNVTFSGNSTGGSGGGMRNGFSSNPTLTNVTFSGNSAAQGGGIYNDNSSPTLTNTIVWGNTAGSGGNEIFNNLSSTATLDYSLYRNRDGESDIVEGDGFTATNSLTDDPLFTDPTDPDGTDDLFGTSDDGLSLLAISPAVDAGDDAALPADTNDLDGDSDTSEPIPFDLAGQTRIQQSAVDIGAYESAGITPDGSNILYVDQNADTEAAGYTAEGDSWANAIPELRDALDWAGNEWDGSSPPLQIWVADGLYTAVEPADVNNVTLAEREATFQLVSGVEVYGGFAGTESTLGERDVDANPTILSGDIDGNDDPFDPDTDSDGNPDTPSQTDHINGDNSGNGNSRHVVTGSGTDDTARLDGFTVTAGLADGDGGGMYNSSGNPTLRNVTFSGNSADKEGGGVYNDNSHPTLTNVTFNGNISGLNHTGGGEGGGMSNFNNSNPTLTNVTFSGNRVIKGEGGGMSNFNNSNPTLTNVTFSGNSAGIGGGMSNTESDPTLTNVTFSGNSADSGGGMSNVGSHPTLTNVTFSGNSAGFGGGGIYNINSSHPTLTNVTFSGNSADRFGGGLFNANGSNPMLTNVTFSGNSAGSDGGGMANGGNPTLTNVIIWNNEADGVTASTSASIFNDSFTPDISHSLIANSGGSGTGWEDAIGNDGDNNIDTDPLFVDPTDPDGADDTFGTDDDGLALQDTSPAFNTGDLSTDLSLFPGGPDNPLDLAGNPRVFDGAADPDIIDMGAYEFQGEPFSPEADDGRVLASNLNGYIFTPAGFGQSDTDASVIVKTLPSNGDLELDGSAVTAADEIPVGDIDDGKLTYMPTAGDHGVNYDSFDFTVKESGIESDPFTMTIDVGAQRVELTDTEGTGGEGWRFLGNPSDGDSYDDLLGPIWTKGIPGSDSPGALFANVFNLDQSNYQWEALADMSNTVPRGEAFIVYVYSDDDNNGTPDSFPKTLTSGESWQPLENEFSYSTLAYDPDQGDDGNSHFLIANPHPVSLDFCGFTSTNVANSVNIWDPSANGGNGDYENLSCGVDDVFIAPFQGFWVRTTDTNPVLEIPEGAYLEGAEEGYFKEGDDERSAKSGEDFADLGGGLTLTVQSEDNIFTNTARILFSEEASVGLDKWDAPKLSPAGLAERWLSFYSLDEEDKAYALQTLPTDFDDKIRIPLDIQTTEAGPYILTWCLSSEALAQESYFLRDNRAGEVMELREGGEYRFEIAPNQTSKVSETLEVLGKERSAKSFGDFADLGGGTEPRFELLIAAAGVDGMTELGAVPEEFTLSQNYPNPFNPTTVISYQLPVNSEVRLEVFDMLGRNVATLVNGQVSAGRHTVNFDASGLSSGVYLYRLAAGSTIMTKKLTVVK